MYGTGCQSLPTTRETTLWLLRAAAHPASLKQKARRALNRAKPLIGRKPTKPSWVPPEVIDISVARLHDLPLFDPDAYLELNPTLKGKVTKPYNHAIARASKGPFTMFEPQAVARVLAKEAFEPDLVTAETTPISGTEASSLPPIGIYASSYGNVFMREIAEDLAHDFRLLGADVEVLDETADIEARRPVTIVVARTSSSSFTKVATGRRRSSCRAPSSTTPNSYRPSGSSDHCRGSWHHAA